MLHERLGRVRERIGQACRRCGRQPSSVTLIGVTKTVPPEIIREAVALGLTQLGENRVQDARAKQQVLGVQPVRWHLIGHLQSNKAKLAVDLFEVIQSVDSLALIQVLEHAIQTRPRPLDVLVQVNVAGESTKFGCTPQDTEELARAVRQSSRLKLAGLMTIPPLSNDPEAARPHFRRLRQLRDEVAGACGVEPAALKLSMGMSQDFEVAIEEGADWIRVGTAIFGERTP